MFKSKSFLLSSAALMMFFALSAPAAHAMEDESSELSSAQAIAKKYPITEKGYLYLKKDARKGNLVALDEVMRRYEQECIRLDKDDLPNFFKIPNLEERILTKPGYAEVLLGVFKEEGIEHFPFIISKIKQKADEGNPVAQYSLGIINFNRYQDRSGKLPSEAEARRYLSLAADQGYTEALVDLSVFSCGYHDNDEGKRLSLLRKAMQKGSPRAAYMLHDMPDNSEESQANHTIRAARKGHAGGLYDVSLLLLNRKIGSKNSMQEVLQLTTIGASASQSGNDYACAYLRDYFHEKVYTPIIEVLKWNLFKPKFAKQLDPATKQMVWRDLRDERLRNDENRIKGALPRHYTANCLEEMPRRALKLPNLHPTQAGSHLSRVFKILQDIEPGFMITAIRPSDSFRSQIDNYVTDQFFSLDIFDGKEYFTIGVLNCDYVKKFKRSMKKIDSEKNEAVDFINESIKKGLGARNKEFLEAYPFW